MFNEGLLDKILRFVKKLIPKPMFELLAPWYHAALAYCGALLYGLPSKSMKVIGVTGTKGKSTTVFLITKFLEDSGHSVAAIGSLGFKIKDKTWPNNLKMTMPGRMKLQKFLHEAKRAGCEYVVLEVTSEGIMQKRHLGVQFDCAVFTNLHKEHIDRHGSFKNYVGAKQELFKSAKNIHVLNADDPNLHFFVGFPAQKKIFYGLERGEMRATNVKAKRDSSSFEVYGTHFEVALGGRFNVYNCLAALSTAAMYGVDLPSAQPILQAVKGIPGRMEFIQHKPFAVVVDYAHTPDSLRSVYETLKPARLKAKSSKLICVLGAAGGGRDTWKRPEFGKIAAEYCDEVILTNEDPYDENPGVILEQIATGLSQTQNSKLKTQNFLKILDRREAIQKAISFAEKGDTVIITGKGSETSIAVAGGEKIPWSDSQVAREALAGRSS